MLNKKLDFGCALWGDDVVDYSYGFRYDLTLFFQYLICYKGVTRFYFTNFRKFNKLCHEILTELKVEFTSIKRIWVVKNYGINIFSDDYPVGYTSFDFEDKQHVSIKDPLTGMEENIRFCKSILQLSLFNIFCFDRFNYKNHLSFVNLIAYKLCRKEKSKKAVFNVYVPRCLREYHPF